MKYIDGKIQYEIGDWVVGLHGISHDFEDSKEGAWCIVSFEGNIKIGKRGRWSEVRPATQEEINRVAKEEKIMIGEYEVKFGEEVNIAENWGKEFIKVGCQIVSKDLFLKIGKKAGWI